MHSGCVICIGKAYKQNLWHNGEIHIIHIRQASFFADVMVILGVFTPSLHRKMNMVRPTVGQGQDFRKAITCVQYLIDFALLSRYRSHIDSTIEYMEKYLQQFHKTKDVF